MAITRLMSWDKRRKRWYKKYRRDDGQPGDKIYAWNPESGGYPRNADGSVLAANCWWESRRREIDALVAAKVTPPDPVSLTVAGLVDRTGGVEQLRREVAELEAKRRLLELLERGAVGGVEETVGAVTLPNGEPATMTVTRPDPHTAYELAKQGKQLQGADETLTWVEGLDWPSHTLTDAERVERLQAIGDRISGDATPASRTVSAWVEKWVESLLVSVKVGTMSLGRWERYARDVRKFAKWAGESRDVSVITSPLLEAFHGHLGTKMADNAVAPSTAQHAMMTAKQFSEWLATRDVIPYPKVVRSRRLSIGIPDQEVEPFEVEEVRAVLKAAKGYSERTFLFVLMMLNCGMYPNDISTLTFKEWDKKAGTITRYRSKTKKTHALKKRKKVTWLLWPETQALLLKYAAKSGDRVLVNEKGRPLVSEQIEGEKYRRYNCIDAAVKQLKKVVEVRLPIKSFRKTSATLLESDGCPDKGWARYFLAQASADVAEQSYIRPDMNPFFRVLGWLRRQYLEGEAV